MDSSAAPPAPRRKSDTDSHPTSPASAASPLYGQDRQGKGAKTSSTEVSTFLDGSDHGGPVQHAFEPVPCRNTSCKKFWGDAVLDGLQILLVIPFFCLGIIVLVQDGKTTAEVRGIYDITAAISYGPTVFPILFSLIVGRFMKAALRWRLERRATVETIEQLHGSRTVTSAVTTQIKLQSFNLLAIGIILLWALSPIGSQAALRIAAVVPVVNNVGFNLTYLDVRNQFDSRQSGISRSLATGLFTSSILMPHSDEGWDAWGNTKIPMIESLEGSTPSMEWISTEGRNVSYASLIGIPAMINSTLEAAEGTNASFSLDTSYWWLNCSTEQITNDSWVFPDPELASESMRNQLRENPFRDGSTRMAWGLPYDRVSASTDPNHVSWLPINDTTAESMPLFEWKPRRIDFMANNTQKTGSRFAAKCYMTTTFVTVNATCGGAASSQPLSTSRPLQRCRPTAIRRAQLNETRSAVTILDFLRISRNNTGRAVEFLEDFVKASPDDVNPSASLHAGYLANPDSPGSFETDFPDWSAVSARDFSMRLARLLNTYWVASVGYKPVQGNFNRKMSLAEALEADVPGGLGGVFNYVDGGLGAAGIPHEALKTDAAWTAVLLAASAVLLAAAVATLLVNLRRKIPSGIENFSSLLRDTPHAQVMSGGQKWPLTTSSMLDGFERSRLLKDVVIQVGDVAPAAPYGYAALGTPETVEMERLKKGRKYM